MIYKKIDIRCEESLESAVLQVYIQDCSQELALQERPVIIVCPGGAYGKLSDREGEIVALQFAAMGYHAAVLKYSIAPAVFPTANLELGKAILFLREKADEWKIQKNKIGVLGFSAGGHMAASYCMFWNHGWMAERLKTEAKNLQPNAMLLAYPVINSGIYAHTDSFKNLLGQNYQIQKEEMSLEKQVNKDVPPSFIWNTYEDKSVPVQNSMLLVESLLKNEIPTEYHMFHRGGHGLSLARPSTQGNNGFGVELSCQVWIQMAYQWLEDWRLHM